MEKQDKIVRIPILEWYPCKWFNDTTPLPRLPNYVVLHSGETYPGVAEYEAKTGGYVLNNKLIRTGYHIAYSSVRSDFVQQISLSRRSWATGGSYIKGKPANEVSWSIALPGPYNQDYTYLHNRLYNIVEYLSKLSNIYKVYRHKDLSRTKKDCNIDVSIFDSLVKKPN